MPYTVEFIDSAAMHEWEKLDPDSKELVNKGLGRLALRAAELGKPLSGELSGCKELKFRGSGLRIVFRIIEAGNSECEKVQIIAIGKRERGLVFDKATSRKKRFG